MLILTYDTAPLILSKSKSKSVSKSIYYLKTENPILYLSASIQVKLDTDTDLDTDFVNKIISDYFPLTEHWMNPQTRSFTLDCTEEMGLKHDSFFLNGNLGMNDKASRRDETIGGVKDHEHRLESFRVGASGVEDNSGLVLRIKGYKPPVSWFPVIL
ncbi:MAG: hypothetical protein HGA97_04185 [Chlorobiaceae bacterium]|nr:hypothetical protein [Chlorobiaceae bacterium]